MEPDAAIGLAGNLTGIGFVVWLAHRMTTKTIPEMTQQFTSATQKQRDDFRDTLTEQREAHEAVMKSVMDNCIARRGPKNDMRNAS